MSDRINELQTEAIDRLVTLADEPEEFFQLMEDASAGRVMTVLDVIFEGDTDEFFAEVGNVAGANRFLKRVFNHPKVKRLSKS